MNAKGYGLIVLFFIILIVRGEESSEGCTTDECASDPVGEKVKNLEKEGSNYLHNVIKQLQEDKLDSEIEEVPEPSLLNFQMSHGGQLQEEVHESQKMIYNITGPTPVPDIEAEFSEGAPPLELSKEELLALYQAAVAKANQLKLLKSTEKPEEAQAQIKPSHHGQMQGPLAGYYYYYFPIKSFMSSSEKPSSGSSTMTASSTNSESSSSSPQQVHATVTMIDSTNKSVEPLFMAISSFIGLALFFFMSVIFVPRLNKVKTNRPEFKDTDDDMGSVGLVLLEAMAGRDCSERLACEITRIFRNLKANNKALRILEIVLPPNLSRQISSIRKAAGKKARCSYIACKMKKEKPPAKTPVKNSIKTYRPKPLNDKKTPHDLWMKHFEKKKPPAKQQQTNRNRQPPKKQPNNRPPKKQNLAG